MDELGKNLGNNDKKIMEEHTGGKLLNNRGEEVDESGEPIGRSHISIRRPHNDGAGNIMEYRDSIVPYKKYDSVFTTVRGQLIKWKKGKNE
jgi:hypothetical protein